MTKYRTAKKSGKKRLVSRHKPHAKPTRKVGLLLPGIIFSAAIIAVVITILLLGTNRTSQNNKQPPQTNAASVPSQKSDQNLVSEPNLSVEQRDRNLRKEQLEVAQSLLAAFPDDTNTAFLLGMAHFEQGNVVDAEEYLEKSLKLQPLRADACDHLGRIALLKGQYDKALILFHKAIKNDPAMPGIHFRIAKAYVLLGKLKEAVLELQKDIEIFPKSDLSYSLLGETYLQLKEHQKAKDNFEAAIRIKPDYTKAYYGLATACARLGLKDESKNARQKFKQLEAEDQKAGRHWRQTLEPLMVTRRSVAHTHTDIGRVYNEHGYQVKAEQLWQKAAFLDPNNIDCRFHLSALYLQNRKQTEALKLYEQITQIDPKNGIGYFFIGNINAQLGRFDNAEKAYKKVIEVAPKRSEGYHALARVYLQLNRNLPEAEKLAARAIELDPNNMQYRKTLQLIQERK
ncbi:MAG: tetratricopeptide repeat protein [Planctomycetota bacterium]|jgi:tetratricopeptide (TPR) repeat protein